MIICRSCRSSWPDSALYCGKCKRSFGGRRCPKNHLSPKNAAFCLICGSRELSRPADSLSFGCASRTIAWLVVLILVKLGWPLITLAVVATFNACDWLFGLVFGVRASNLFWQLTTYVLNIAVLVGVFALLVPSFRKRLPALLRTSWKLCGALWRLGKPTFKFTFVALKTLVQGNRHYLNKGRSAESHPLWSSREGPE